MAFKLAEAYVELSSRGFGSVSRTIASISGGMQSLGTGAMGMVGHFTKLTGAAGLLTGALAALGATAGVSHMIKLAADAEGTAVAFATFLGSAEKANKLIADLNKFSDVTPFTPDVVIAAGRSLTALRIPTEQIIPTLGQLGDVASGLQIPLNDLIQIYGKVKNKGRMQGEEILQLAERGVPIYEELAKVFGVTTAEIAKMSEKGEIKFEHLQQVFKNLTGEGGMFHNMMKKQSETLGGLFSTLQGVVTSTMRGIGQEFVELFDLKDVTKGMIDGVGSIKETLTTIFDAVREPLGELKSAVGEFFSTLSGNARSGMTAFNGTENTLGMLIDMIRSGITASTQFIRGWNDLNAKVTPAVVEFFGWMGRTKELIVATFGAGQSLLAQFFGIMTAGRSPIDSLISGYQTVYHWLSEITDAARILVENYDLTWAIMQEQALLFVQNTVERFQAGFKNLGELAQWFGENWSDILFSVFDYATTVFINLGQNIRNMFGSLWDWIQSGFEGSFEIDWTPLTEGFHNSIKRMPQLTEAQIQTTNKKLEELYKEMDQREQKRADEREKRFRLPASPTLIPDTAEPSIAEAMNSAKSDSGDGKFGDKIGFSQMADTVQKAILSADNKIAKDQLNETKQVKKNTEKMADQLATGLKIAEMPAATYS